MILALIHDIRKLALNPNANAIDINQKISEFNGFDFSSHPRTLNKSTKEVPIIPPFKRQRKELPLDAASAEPKKSCFLDREAFEALREIKLDDFSYLLHNLSLLSEKSEILINATQISIVAIALIISKGESSAKFISIGISALGNLAKTNKIEGRLDEGFFQPLLTELLMLRPTARDISRAIYALGELAKNKQINLPFANQIFTKLLQKLSEDNPKDIDISNALYGLGLLAQAQMIHEAFDGHEPQNLLKQLSQGKANAQSISNALYGLNEMAKAKILKFSIEQGVVKTLLIKLWQNEPNFQDIATTLYAMGQLATAQILQETVNHHDLEALLSLCLRFLNRSDFSSLNRSAQDISITFYGLGLLAKTKSLDVAIDEDKLKAFLKKLSQLDLIHQKALSISNSLYGLGELAKEEKLSGRIPIHLLLTLLENLRKLNPNAQQISNFIYGLGELAKQRKFNGNLNAELFHSLLEMILQENEDPQVISKTFHGLGQLAHAQILQGVLDEDTLKNILIRFSHINPKLQETSNTLYGLHKLKKFHNFQGDIPSSLLTNVLSQLNFSNLDLRNYVQILPALTDFKYKNTQKIHELFNTIFNLSYLQISDVILLLETYTKFAIDLPDLNHQIFKDLLEKLDLPFQNFSLSQQTRLQMLIKTLPKEESQSLEIKLKLKESSPRGLVDFNPSLDSEDFPYDGAELAYDRETLRSEKSSENDRAALQQKIPLRIQTNMPVIQANRITQARDKRSTNQQSILDGYQGGVIFEAIRDKNLHHLEQILGLKTPTPKEKSIFGDAFQPAERNLASLFEQKAQSILNRNKETTDDLIQFFLRHTNPEMFKALIQQSTHEYFERILRACSKHILYQSAIHHDLNPIILYLDRDELKFFMEDLLNLGIYRDHHAVLNLVDALLLRKQHSRYSEQLNTEQIKLLERAIEHHELSHHKNVTPILNANLLSIKDDHEKLIADDEDEFIEPFTTEERHEITLVNPSNFTKKSAQTENPFLLFSSSRGSIPRFREDALCDSFGHPNMSAWYSTEQMQRILRLKLEKLSKVNSTLLAPLDFHQEASNTVIVNQLRQFLDADHGNETSNLILPICIHAHWVGIRIKIQANAIHLYYYDASPSKSNKDRVMHAATAAIGNIYPGTGIHHEDKSYFQQDDTSSCGVYLIENIFKDLSNRIAIRKSTAAWRSEHIALYYSDAEALNLSRASPPC